MSTDTIASGTTGKRDGTKEPVARNSVFEAKNGANDSAIPLIVRRN
jgi:hypothetical protein